MKQKPRVGRTPDILRKGGAMRDRSKYHRPTKDEETQMTARKSRRVTFEWDYESYDEHDDIVDHNFFDKFPGIPSDDPRDQIAGAVGANLVLVRDVYEGYSDSFNDTASLIDRSWCYVKDGKLPTHFSDASGNNVYEVPKRFFRNFK